jgi:cobalt-precorrin 5A hydrolase / precorrin-3B C17-methyltransferase
MSIAVFVLNQQGVPVARQIRDLLPEVVTYGLASRVNPSDVDRTYETFSTTIQDVFQSNHAIVGICAAGILIRSLAPCLNNKWQEPPVVAIAEDGSAIVPLLGGLNGGNQLAREIADIFEVTAAITTSGDVRFKTALLSPPSGYTLANPDQAKTFLANLLAGQTVKLEGSAPWLETSQLPFAADADLTIQVTRSTGTPSDRTLVYHPPDRITGTLSVIGTGPGADRWMSPEVRQTLKQATDWVGYTTYLNLVEPLRTHQIRHDSDNREELDRARFALDLAASGKSVVMVSSGDPGIFAMAAAVLEAIDTDRHPRWDNVDLQICPGISAMQAAAAKIGAPLGHDFCAISLSDILKPWETIEHRISHAAAGDFVIAFYNPISTQRRWQLERAKELLLEHRSHATPIVLAKNVGRPGEQIRVKPLGDLQLDDADMRTLLIIGSSQTRTIDRPGQPTWVYTPRRYKL